MVRAPPNKKFTPILADRCLVASQWHHHLPTTTLPNPGWQVCASKWLHHLPTAILPHSWLKGLVASTWSQHLPTATSPQSWDAGESWGLALPAKVSAAARAWMWGEARNPMTWSRFFVFWAFPACGLCLDLILRGGAWQHPAQTYDPKSGCDIYYWYWALCTKLPLCMEVTSFLPDVVWNYACRAARHGRRRSLLRRSPRSSCAAMCRG